MRSPTRSASAIVFVTLTAMARVVTYTAARCPNCRRVIMSVPGQQSIEVREASMRRNGVVVGTRGRVVACGRCSAYYEVIEHA